MTKIENMFGITLLLIFKPFLVESSGIYSKILNIHIFSWKPNKRVENLRMANEKTVKKGPHKPLELSLALSKLANSKSSMVYITHNTRPLKCQLPILDSHFSLLLFFQKP